MPFSWLKKTDPTEWNGFIEHGVRIEGKLDAPGTFRIDCDFKGESISAETLVLAEKSVVSSQIRANYVILAGRFDGTIEAKGKVEIKTKAIVTGEIHTPCLIIEPGAIFDGHVHMLSATQSAKPITIPVRSMAASA
ncbi:MAG TPA: polymer-forming cytoskeletal protein [Candidatus Acidoferrum sp.]|nr:polymer-forming cytoskeletal protein [Candidatus Acidoferrum sp.]